MPRFDAGDNPLLSDSPAAWHRLIEDAGPASLLVAIESRMSAALQRRLAPEDIWQETLLHAWRDRAHCEWRGQRGFRSWLLSIIDNRIHDAADREHALKRGGANGTRSLNHPERPASDGDTSFAAMAIPPALAASTTPSRLAMYREQAAAIRDALHALPEDVGEIVRMRLVEHRTIEHIAAHLGIGVAAVRHRFRKGAELYRAHLQAALASRLHSLPPDFTPRRSADTSAKQ